MNHLSLSHLSIKTINIYQTYVDLFNEFLGPKVHNPALGQLGPNKEHAMKIKKEIKRHQIHWEDLGNSSRPQKG